MFGGDPYEISGKDQAERRKTQIGVWIVGSMSLREPLFPVLDLFTRHLPRGKC